MKRLELKKLITCALIISTVTSIGVMPAKATTTSDLYKQAYDATMKVIETGKEYNIAPRHADNNTDLKSNKLDNIYEAVEKGNMQKAINHARECIARLSSNQWQAKNTFSNLLDGYQQPSYEHIVDVALQLNKLTQQDKNKFENPTNWDESKKQEFRNTVKERQHYIEIARALNKGVDSSYGKTYSSALDKPQQTVINMVNFVVEDAKKSSKPSDIEFAESVVKAFKESVSENSNIKNYVTGLQKDMDSLVELSQKNKAALEAQAKEIEALKQEVAKLKNESHKEDFEKEINSLKGEIVNLKNNSSTIVSIPSNQEAIDTQAKLIKELQEQIKNGKPSDYEQVKKIILEDRRDYNTKDIARKIADKREQLDSANSLDDKILSLPDKNFNMYGTLDGAIYNLVSIQSYSICDSATALIENEKNKLFPKIITYMKANGDGIYCNAANLYKYNDDKMKKLLELHNSFIKQEEEAKELKELEELDKISEGLKNVYIDELRNHKRKLSDLCKNINVEKKSKLYTKLNVVCNEYVELAKKSVNDFKNNKSEKSLNIFNVMVICENYDKILTKQQKILDDLKYEFFDFCLKTQPMNITSLDMIMSFVGFYNDDKTKFKDFIIPRIENLLNSNNLTDYNVVQKINDIICQVRYNYTSSTSEYKQLMEISNKLKELQNKLQKEQQGHHEVITPSQGDKEKEHEIEVAKQGEIQKQIKELDDISKKLNNITEDDQASALKERLSKFCGEYVFENEKIEKDSPAYSKLVEVCNQYVKITKKVTNKAKNTRDKKDIAIAESMLYRGAIFPKLSISFEKELLKTSYDFIDFCLNPKYATESTIKAVNDADNLMSNDEIKFNKFLMNKIPLLISKDVLKDKSLSSPVNSLLSYLESRYRKASDEYKTIIKLENKLEELNKEENSNHEVINPNQEEKEIQKQITELDSISNDIKNVKSRVDFELVENKLKEFSRKNLDTNINNKYNSVIVEYMNLLKQNISDLESLDDMYDKNYILYKVKNFEDDIAKNNIQKLEIEDCLNKKISNVVESVNFINNKNNLDESISILERYKGSMLNQGTPYNKDTYNNMFKIYSELAEKVMNEIQKTKSESLIRDMNVIIEAFKYNEKSTSKFYIEGEELEKQLNSIKEKVEKNKQKQDTGVLIEKK